MIILLDTETTGLTKPEPAPLKEQPYITEIYCLKLDSEGNEIGEFERLVKPPIPIPPEITKITGITDQTLRKAPMFSEIAQSLAEFFCGSKFMVAHNLGFDRAMLIYELKRLELEYRFPWPYTHICTAEASVPINGQRMGLAKLYELKTGRPLAKHHRAKDDVKTLKECFGWLCQEGYII